MGTKLNGTFTVKRWDETVAVDLPGEAKVTHASIEQQFEGELEAQAAAELLMHYRDEQSAMICGFQLFEATIGGRDGTFVAEYDARYDGDTATAQLTIVPGSATGGLEGISGQGTAVAGHEPPGSYEFDLSGL